MSLTVRPIPRAELDAALPDIARLRIEVFRAWPYLYDGDMAYEERYLQAYRDSAQAVVVGAWDGDRMVGAATGAPMDGQHAEWAEPFRAQGRDVSEIFYCGESVLLPEYRGRGVGHAFFDWREARARDLGKRVSAFCSVIRPKNHPLEPEGHRPLDGFWRKRGYAPEPGLEAVFDWREVGAAEETPHRLQFWLRRLDDA